MAATSTVQEAVKESLLGHEETAQLSAQTRARFLKNAVPDAETGELVMGPVEFIDAIAPEGEDYVRPISLVPSCCPCVRPGVLLTVHISPL